VSRADDKYLRLGGTPVSYGEEGQEQSSVDQLDKDTPVPGGGGESASGSTPSSGMRKRTPVERGAVCRALKARCPSPFDGDRSEPETLGEAADRR